MAETMDSHLFVTPAFMQEVTCRITDFINSPYEHEMNCPTYLMPAQQSFILNYCSKYHLPIFFRGSTLVIRKPADGQYVKDKNQYVNKHYSLPMELRATYMARGHIQLCFSRLPLYLYEKQMLYYRPDYARLARKCLWKPVKIPPLPPPAKISPLSQTAYRLPAWGMKDEVLNAIQLSPICLISGETGSGKTTQVPKMILDYATENDLPCKIICTQPRRISAVSVATRVSEERGEICGQTVGYQIRLESRTSERTSLIFCTIGVLLRIMMSDDNYLHGVTHVIVDEVHERDRMCDFLLIVLKLNMRKYSHLKVILMSANLDVDLYAEYFGKCPVVEIPGRMFPVEEYYLEDILRRYDLITEDMSKKIEIYRSKGIQNDIAWKHWQTIRESVDIFDREDWSGTELPYLFTETNNDADVIIESDDFSYLPEPPEMLTESVQNWIQNFKNEPLQSTKLITKDANLFSSLTQCKFRQDISEPFITDVNQDSPEYESLTDDSKNSSTIPKHSMKKLQYSSLRNLKIKLNRHGDHKRFNSESRLKFDDSQSDSSDDVYVTPATSPEPFLMRKDKFSSNFDEVFYRAAKALISNGFYPEKSLCPSNTSQLPSNESIFSGDVCASIESSRQSLNKSNCLNILKGIDMASLNRSNNSEAITSLMTRLMEEAFANGFYQHFSAMITLIESNKVSPDFQHPETLATPLMVCAGRGHIDFVKTLLCKGASVGLQSKNGWTAYDWAQVAQHYDVMEYLAHFSTMNIDDVSVEALSMQRGSNHNSMEDTYLLKAFYDEHNSQDIINFLFKILYMIHTREEPGGILVFLPGYNEIAQMKDAIERDTEGFGASGPHLLFTLHSCMPSREQQQVFKKIRPGVRKIILATNIAETSITIEDIVYVLDSGLFREKTYDAIADSSCLAIVKVSQASAIQRRGRAGRCRPGKSFHLFSRLDFQRMQPHQTPEILRTPLQDLCLQAKLLASKDMAIASFLSHAPQPPSVFSVANAVETLKRMDALDSHEHVTELGRLLAELPLVPHLAKMVLYSTIFRCLDPILTIASFLTQKDPFRLPDKYIKKHLLRDLKEKFADNTQSDHYALLHCYYSYRKYARMKKQHEWTKRYHISVVDMEAVYKTKKQLLTSLYTIGWLPFVNNDLREYNAYSCSWALIKGVLVAGMYPNIIRSNPTGYYTEKLERVDIDGRSAVFIGGPPRYNINLDGSKPEDPLSWMIYDDLFMLDNSRTFVRNATPVSPLAVFLFGGLLRDKRSHEIETRRFMVVPNDIFDQKKMVDDYEGDGSKICLDDGFLTFNRYGLEEFLYLRYKVQSMVLRHLMGHQANNDHDFQIVNTVADALTFEDTCRSIARVPPSMESTILEELDTLYDTTSHGYRMPPTHTD